LKRTNDRLSQRTFTALKTNINARVIQLSAMRMLGTTTIPIHNVHDSIEWLGIHHTRMCNNDVIDTFNEYVIVTCRTGQRAPTFFFPHISLFTVVNSYTVPF
jgi:hypothetical protein